MHHLLTGTPFPMALQRSLPWRTDHRIEYAIRYNVRNTRQPQRVHQPAAVFNFLMPSSLILARLFCFPFNSSVLCSTHQWNKWSIPIEYNLLKLRLLESHYANWFWCLYALITNKGNLKHENVAVLYSVCFAKSIGDLMCFRCFRVFTVFLNISITDFNEPFEMICECANICVICLWVFFCILLASFKQESFMTYNADIGVSAFGFLIKWEGLSEIFYDLNAALLVYCDTQ